MTNNILVDFDLNKKTAYVTGQIKGLELMERKAYELNYSSYQQNTMLYFEIEVPAIDSKGNYVPPGPKWEFTYKQYSKHKQILQLEQFALFPTYDNVFQPKKYDPRTSLACWSYIANPSKGTTQTKKVNEIIHPNFGKDYNLKMTVEGSPSVEGWSTDN